MTVTIQLQKPDGTLLSRFAANDRQSIAQMVNENGVNIPTACGIGMCGVCKCRIVSGQKYVQIDKITTPITPLQRDQDGSFQEVFSCVWGIRSEAVKDSEDHLVVLEKQL